MSRGGKVMKAIINQGQPNEKEFEINGNSIGSEKQIDWADRIKLKKISDMFLMLSQPGMSKHETQIIELCKKMNQVVDAKFWIDNKNNMAKNIAKELKQIKNTKYEANLTSERQASLLEQIIKENPNKKIIVKRIYQDSRSTYRRWGG